MAALLQVRSATILDTEEFRRPGPRRDGQGRLIQPKRKTVIFSEEKMVCSMQQFEPFRWHLQSNDSGLASYVAGQIDRTLSWKVMINAHRCYNKLTNKLTYRNYCS